MGTIRIETKFFILAFIYFFFPARVRVDGGEFKKLGWFKTTELSLAAGAHHLVVNHPYIIPSWNHQAEVDVTVQEGQTVSLQYYAPMLAFLPGRMKTVSTPA